MFSSKSIESFIIIVVMSCRGMNLFKKGTLNFSADKMYSNVALRIWGFSLSFMFSLPKGSV